jgi:carbon storage regulator
MLVLSRRPGQSILIGKDIEIVVLGSGGVQVRVGIRAPREVTVLRRELLKQVEEENKRAIVTNLGSLGAALGQIGAPSLDGLGQNLGVSPAEALPAKPSPTEAPRRRRVGAA